MNKQLRVLILEDNDVDAELMERELKKANITFQSKRVGTGETFQKELKDFSPDIILADYTLPAFDGCSALKIAKERYPDVPFIFVSGTIGEDFAIESLKSGATDYVIKDRISRLAPAVHRALSEVEERIEYRRAERALRESEARFRSLVESANDAIILTDGSGSIISCNKSAQRIFGYSAGEMLGKSILHIMPERYRSDHQMKMEYICSNSKLGINGKTIESYGLRKDGSEFPLEISIATWGIEGGTFYSAIVRDITERKKDEEELKIKAQLLDDSTDSVFVHDLDGNFIYLNESAYKSRGFDKGEMMCINLHELVTPEYERLLKSRFKALVEKGEGTFESAHFRKDRSVIPVESHARIIESGGKKLVLSIIRDITERKRADQALQYRLDFEKLITSISTNFINMASDKIDEEINHALAIIGEFTDVDRSYVLLGPAGGARTGVTHEWNSGTIGSHLQELKEVPFESSPWFVEKMKNHETIYIPSFTDLPPGAGIELSKYQDTRIKSIIVAPMVYGGVLFGYLGLTSVRKEITLAEDLIALLKIVGEIFMSALVRKMAEEAIWESETRFRAIFENAAIGMALMNIEGHTIVSNPALQEMLRYTGEELRSIVFTGLTHPDDMPADTGMFKDLMAGERDNYQIEKRYIRKDGSQFWGRLTVSLVRGDGGEPQFGIGMVEDITERKRAEELLKEKARAELYGFIVSALPVFASGVPSQVRNTLVKNFAERFEKNIMPRFEEEMRRYDHDRNISSGAIEAEQGDLDFFVSWLIGMFSNLGIRTRTAPQATGRVFELLNCPWKGEASGNPIFCFICRTIMRRSLTWTPFKGSADQKSSIANGSQVCRFEIHVKCYENYC